ncbi:nonribosomal peptide synthetase 1 [Stemphylium lycopersici]|nr:nonribosomal peptide synthetase 1 [Stemphylium lycopersici]RAQ98592.1 nonribosomal peptide synthetase 1 [Stemphylium lycopersici]
MKLVGEARKQGFSMTVAGLFKHHKIRDLCLHLKSVGDQPLQHYAAFSLLPLGFKESLLSSLPAILPVSHCAEVLDILPSTSFQETIIRRHIRNPCQGFNYFYFDIGPQLHIPLLRSSCSKLLERFTILRTIFVEVKESIWQIVVGSHQISFAIFDVEGPLLDESYAICALDRESSSPHDLPTGFLLLRHSSGYRLILRLSHAQYDGLSLPVIFNALSDLYDNKPLLVQSTFPAFLKYTRNRQPHSAVYWKSLLEGSQMTLLTPLLYGAEKAEIARPVFVQQRTPAVRLPHNLTSATLISSAWALLNSYLTGDKNIVYGHLIAGRNSDVPGIENVLGPCVNIIPVLAQVNPGESSIAFMSSMQHQFLSLGESDSMGLPDIIQHCTQWPTETNFDSVIQFQNVDETSEFEIAGGTSNFQALPGSHDLTPTLFILSYQQGNEFIINIHGNTHLFSLQCAEALLNMLCELIKNLSSGLNTSVDLCMSRLSHPFNHKLK